LFSDAEVATVPTCGTIHDSQLMVGTNDDGCKLKQCSGASQAGPDVKLKVVNVERENDGELVECQLETAKHSSVSFKFSPFTNPPDDVAASLVRQVPRIYALLTHTRSNRLCNVCVCFTYKAI